MHFRAFSVKGKVQNGGYFFFGGGGGGSKISNIFWGYLEFLIFFFG